MKLMEELELKKEFITLGQFLQVEDFVASGAEAKQMVKELPILVNGQKEERRGRKLYATDIIEIAGRKFLIKPWKSKK